MKVTFSVSEADVSGDREPQEKTQFLVKRAAVVGAEQHFNNTKQSYLKVRAMFMARLTAFKRTSICILFYFFVF